MVTYLGYIRYELSAKPFGNCDLKIPSSKNATSVRIKIVKEIDEGQPSKIF